MNFDSIYVARQPILDAEKNIFGYELLFRSSEKATVAGVVDNFSASAQVLLNTLSYIGLHKITGDKIAFFNVDHDFLIKQKDLIKTLPKEKLIIEILETTKVTPELVEIIGQMADEGFQFALDDFVFNDDIIEYFKPLYKFITILKIDLSTNNKENIIRKLNLFRNKSIKLLAEKVEDIDQFKTYKSLGFEYFQGYYFSKPEIITGRKVDPKQRTLIELINLLQRDADVDQLERVFRKNPGLSLNLLKFINSAALYIASKITSIQHAITLMGQKQLMQWILLLTYSGQKLSKYSNPLLETASLRGKIMEILIRKIKGKQDKKMEGEAFLVGLLSLIDVLFSAPLPDLLAEMNLAPEVKKALTEHEGQLGKLLKLIKLTEENNQTEMEKLLSELNLKLTDISQANIESYTWLLEFYKDDEEANSETPKENTA